MTTIQTLDIGNNRFELLTLADSTFAGIGRVWIGETLVRSGRLPWSLYTQSFTGHESGACRLQAVDVDEREARISLSLEFQPLRVKLLRDHSFDPIHDLGDWEAYRPSGSATITLVIRPEAAEFDGIEFRGFTCQIEYASSDMPIFYLMERTSWEVGGDINGATVYNQSSCSAPVVTFHEDTEWSTEGYLFFLDEHEHPNRCMTHNLPRWCDHQWFDFQWKDNQVLLGLFEHVDLIRTVLMRDAGRPELKCFDKHIFDETTSYTTSPKSILLSTTPVSSKTQAQNLWTRIYEETGARARAEFGLEEELPYPCLAHHYWHNYTIDTSYRDILPAAEALGVKSIFAENFKKSDASEVNRLPKGNMCCSQEYEIAPSKGGSELFKAYIDRCRKAGIMNFMWTNTYVSLAAELNAEQRDPDGWFMAMEDTRIKYGGAYTMVSSNLDLKNPDARRYWVEAHKKIVDETGLDGYFIDSHYNLFFMPVNYKTGHPRTSWRESLEVMKELQDHGVRWQVESFGPFGRNMHGHPDSYGLENVFISINCGLGNNTVTVPVPGSETKTNDLHDIATLYYIVAHRVPPKLPLFIDGVRIDQVYGDEHRRVIREYTELLPQMHTRYLQEDGEGVLYHDEEGRRAIFWNFVERCITFSGEVTDVSTGASFHADGACMLQPRHTYRLTADRLPKQIQAAEDCSAVSTMDEARHVQL